MITSQLYVPFASSEPLAVDLRADLFDDSLAVFSRSRTHRYLLTRRWGRGEPMVLMMLNPSTADAHIDDPTIIRATGFARRDGYGGLVVLNLYGLRATDPDTLARADDPVGADNDAMITALTTDPAGPVVAAWGAIAYRARHRARTTTVVAGLAARGVRLHCLGRTQDGYPRHPLYLPRTTSLTTWTPDLEESER